MLCDACKKNEAVVHYAEVVNGEIKKLNICEQCAKEKGFGVEVSFSMGDMLGGLIKDSSMEIDKTVNVENSCRTCGMTYEEFRKTGRLGCDKCYEVFEKKLISILDTIHKHTRHKGKIPKDYRDKFNNIMKIKELNKMLKEAVDNEEFEEAAVLRDKIRSLTRKSNLEVTS